MAEGYWYETCHVEREQHEHLYLFWAFQLSCLVSKSCHNSNPCPLLFHQKAKPLICLLIYMKDNVLMENKLQGLGKRGKLIHAFTQKGKKQ